MRALWGIAGLGSRCAYLLFVAGTVLMACGGSGTKDAAPHHPALELLKFVPDYPQVAGCWMDDRAYLDAIGMGYVDTQEELMALDFDRWLDTPAWQYAFSGAELLMRDEDLATKLGISPLSVQEHLAIPYDDWTGGESFGVRRLPIDEPQFTEALLDLGYARQRHVDDEYFKIDTDIAIESRPFVPVEMWQVRLSDDLMVHGGSMFEDALDAFRARVPSLGRRQDVVESMEALGSIHMACVVDGDQPRRQLRERVEEHAEIFADLEEPGWEETVELLKGQYPGWGKLYEPELFVAAYVAQGETGTMKIALWYEEPETAAAVRPELERRMREYSAYPSEDYVCDEVEVFLAGHVVVGDCKGGLADNWFNMFRYGGYYFLTDDLSSAQTAPCPATGEPCT